jgi:hypothetical protein
MGGTMMAGKPLTETEKLIRDIKGLQVSIDLAGPEFLNASNAQDRKVILDHLAWCKTEIVKLGARLKQVTQ